MCSRNCIFDIIAIIIKQCICCCGDDDAPKSPSDGNFFWLLLVQWGRPPESRLLEFLQHLVEDECEGMEGDSDIVMEDVCDDGMQNLGGGWC